MFGRRKKRAIVLGCGPAGMFVTHALFDAGWDVTVLSKKRPSQMFGAQYLHKPIPGLPEISRKVKYKLIGTGAGYAQKVYGPDWQQRGIVPSVFELVGESPAWNIRTAYYEAYERYANKIVDTPLITGPWLQAADTYYKQFSGATLKVITIPIQSICLKPGDHFFAGRKIWAMGDAPELNQVCVVEAPPQEIVCNGMESPAWYRASHVFGFKTCEWPYDRKPPISGVAEVIKPVNNNCNCFPGWKRAGRYGAWRKGYLAHHAYEEAREWAR